MNNPYDCLIIGCGPCGIGAALKLQEANKRVAIIERSTPGGKVNIAPRVDNYPGFTKIPGPELAVEFYKRVLNHKIEMISDDILSLKKEGEIFTLKGENLIYFARTVLIASGTKERKLGLTKEDEMLGHGLSYCAICDGHFFKNKDVIIIGGGNSALKEAIYLTKLCSHVTLIHRRNEFRGLNHLVDELKEHENATVLTPYVPVEILGDDHVTGIKIKKVDSEEITELKVDGIFPLVGQIPNSQFVDIEGVKDEWNTIPVDKSMKTAVDGLYAGGDVLPRQVKQIYLSEHDGMVAAKSIIEYLGK